MLIDCKSQIKALGILLTALAITGCKTVRTEDLVAWEGQPVAALDMHPVFLSMPLIRTQTPAGVEIRNYVNGKSVSECSGGGALFAGSVDFASYNSFTTCTASTPTCNNIFYIERGVVTRYTPVGTGGLRCFTDDRVRPNFRGPANI